MRVDDDQDDVDEVLPGQDHPPTSHRVRVAGWVVLVLAVIGALVGVVIHNHSRPAALPTPSTSAPSPSTTRTSTANVGPVAPISPCDEISSDGLSCSVTSDVPVTVRNTIRGVLPHAVITVHTVIGARSDSLFERTIHADTDNQSLDIMISTPGGPSPDSVTTDASSGRVIGAQTDVGEHLVVVNIDGTPPPRTPPIDVARLAKDHRLLVLH